MQKSYWEMESGFQFGKEQVGCPALITQFKLPVGVSHSSLSLCLFFSPSPSSLLYCNFLFIFIILSFFLTRCILCFKSQVGCRIFGSTPHTIGAIPKSSCGKQKIKLSSVQGQLSIRAEELLPLSLFPFRSVFIAEESFQGQ